MLWSNNTWLKNREIDLTLLTKFENKIKQVNESIDVLNGIAFDKIGDG